MNAPQEELELKTAAFVTVWHREQSSKILQPRTQSRLRWVARRVVPREMVRDNSAPSRDDRLSSPTLGPYHRRIPKMKISIRLPGEV